MVSGESPSLHFLNPASFTEIIRNICSLRGQVELPHRVHESHKLRLQKPLRGAMFRGQVGQDFSMVSPTLVTSGDWK